MVFVFDEGNFSENETFLITDSFKDTPREVLAKNFGVPEAAFANIPIDVAHDRYIFTAKVPGPLAADAVQSPAGAVPQTFSHRMLAQEPIKAARGTVRTDGPVRVEREGADLRLPGRRRGLRSVCDWALRPEHWRRAAALA